MSDEHSLQRIATSLERQTEIIEETLLYWRAREEREVKKDLLEALWREFLAGQQPEVQR